MNLIIGTLILLGVLKSFIAVVSYAYKRITKPAEKIAFPFLSALVFFGCVAFYAFAFIIDYSPSAAETTPSPFPGPTRIQIDWHATQTLRAQRTCTPSTHVTASNAGQNLCVYGVVTDLREYYGASQIRFGGVYEFFFSSGTYFYPGVAKGACVYAIGEVLLSSEKVPYINVDKNPVYICEPWMLNQ